VGGNVFVFVGGGVAHILFFLDFVWCGGVGG